MRNNKRKGFTIVELVIVIAVIAILAAVLIPTFTSLINSAKEAADIQLVRNLNTTLATEEAANGKNATAYDAIKVANTSGYSIEKLTPTSLQYDVVWDQTTNRFVLLDGDKAVYSDQGTGYTTDKNKLWKIYGSVAEAQNDNKGYAAYIRGNGNIDTVTVSTSFDVGENTVSELTLESSEAANFTVRTNSGKFSVDAGNASVSHFGFVNELTVTDIANNSYHEYGAVSGAVKLNKGRFVVESGANVNVIAITGAVTGISIEQKSNSQLFKVVSANGTALTGSEENIKVLNNETIKTDVVSDSDLENIMFGGGNGTAENPYELYTAGHMVTFANYINDGKAGTAFVNAKLCADIDITGMAWEPIGNALSPFYGSFDGDGHTIKGFSNKGYEPNYKLFGTTGGAYNYGMAYGFFGVIGKLKNTDETETTYESMTFTNVNFTDVDLEIDYASNLGVLIGADIAATEIGNDKVNRDFASDITISKVTVSGSVKSLNDSGATVGGVAGKLYAKGALTVLECTNNCPIYVIGKLKAAGIAGYVVYQSSISFNSCVNNANIEAKDETGTFVSGIANSSATGLSSATFTNNVNTGDVKHKNNKGAYIAVFLGNINTITNVNFTGNTNTGKHYLNGTETATYNFVSNGGASLSCDELVKP